MRRLLFILVVLELLAGCVSQPRNYKPAGFSDVDEVWPYIKHTNYLAVQLSKKEWSRFYKRFPEYWDDLQTYKTWGGTMEYHPWYTAYAFRWISLKSKKTNWTDVKVHRLDAGSVSPGDSPFEIFYAISPPDRLLWDNDFEILLYRDGKALVMDSGKLKAIRLCAGCWLEEEDAREEFGEKGFHDTKILATLQMERPKY